MSEIKWIALVGVVIVWFWVATAIAVAWMVTS